MANVLEKVASPAFLLFITNLLLKYGDFLFSFQEWVLVYDWGSF